MGEESDAAWQAGLIEAGREDAKRSIRNYKDPSCPKCGIILGDKMMFVCPRSHCPVGLN
jgi:hypothetical protein